MRKSGTIFLVGRRGEVNYFKYINNNIQGTLLKHNILPVYIYNIYDLFV